MYWVSSRSSGWAWKEESARFILDAADTLLPLLYGARDRVLHKNSKEFQKHQRIVKCAVDTAKEEWTCKVACNAEKTRRMVNKDGCA